MKKSFKQLLTLALACCMALGVGVAATACAESEHKHTFETGWSSDSAKHWHAATCEHKTEKSEEGEHIFGEDNKCTVCGYQKVDESQKTTYTVTVLSFDNVPVPDVELTFGDEETVYTTDKDGKVTAELPKATYEIKVDEETVPYVYALGETVSVTAENTTATVTLAKPADIEEGWVLYTITVLKPDGTPVKGLRVQLCSTGEGGMCTPFTDATNSRGETRNYLAPGNYEAQILPGGMPDGYTYDVNAEDHYTGDSATAEKTTVTIQLKVAE